MRSHHLHTPEGPRMYTFCFCKCEAQWTIECWGKLMPQRDGSQVTATNQYFLRVGIGGKGIGCWGRKVRVTLQD
jgi:hypothetical protein